MLSEVHCRKCGYCCHFFADGELRKCKHLVVLNGCTLCRIYNLRNRLGSIIYSSNSTIVRCNLISNVKINFFGCPYNVSKNLKFGVELPMFEFCIPWINSNLKKLEEKPRG